MLQLSLSSLSEGSCRRRRPLQDSLGLCCSPGFVGHAAQSQPCLPDETPLYLKRGGNRDEREGVAGAVAHLAVERIGGERR